MGTEAKSIRLHIDADPRLAAAVGGAARYLADAAGMENDAVAQLQAAVIAACRELFSSLKEDHPSLNVTLTRLPDRIEVSMPESTRRRIPAFCPLCASRCGCEVVVEDGRLVAIEPDPLLRFDTSDTRLAIDDLARRIGKE